MTYQYYHTMQCAKCFRVCRLSDSGKTWVCTICKHREKANGGKAVSDHLGNANKMVGEDVSNEQMTAHATPNEELRRQILSHVVPKNEREWWAARAIERLEFELNAANDRIKRLEDCAETAWGIIANVDSGSWQEQRADWREATTRWRDEQFHPELSERKAKEAKP